jgi:hypothetical protein
MSKQAAASAASEITTEIFDIGIFETQDVGHLTMVHPLTGAPTTWIWTVAGPGHATTVAQGERIARRVLREAREKEEARVNGKKWHGENKDPSQIKRENAEFFADRLLGWTHVRFGAEDYPFSRENAISLLLNPKMGLLYNQVAEYFRNDESFMKRSAPIS